LQRRCIAVDLDPLTCNDVMVERSSRVVVAEPDIGQEVNYSLVAQRLAPTARNTTGAIPGGVRAVTHRLQPLGLRVSMHKEVASARNEQLSNSLGIRCVKFVRIITP